MLHRIYIVQGCIQYTQYSQVSSVKTAIPKVKKSCCFFNLCGPYLNVAAEVELLILLIHCWETSEFYKGRLHLTLSYKDKTS